MLEEDKEDWQDKVDARQDIIKRQVHKEKNWRFAKIILFVDFPGLSLFLILKNDNIRADYYIIFFFTIYFC